MQMHPSSKLSVVWVTDLIDKYRYNLFHKTATNVVALQLVLALVSLLVLAWGIEYAQERTLFAVSERIVDGVFLDSPASSESLMQAVETVSNETHLYAAIILIVLNIVFGLLIARFALWPTRNSLQFQKKFIGNIAHEIRTPLAIIKTNTEVALFDPKLPASVKETFTDTIVELDRISETINNLLSFDTLTRPRRMVFEPTNLCALAHTILKRHQALADSRGVELIAAMDEDCFVCGNSVALEQVVTNLVKNAVNYTPKDKGGSVTVTVAPEPGNKVMLSVKDTGIGIDQKDLFHIFEPFYRGDTSRARGIGTGTSGLGLAIVNEIIRLHKGAITIRSTPGKGTEIRVILPAVGAKNLPDPLANDTTDSTNEVSVDFS
ncbi:MAG: Two-component system, OmpR family, phosphate regulon sensor histidine kinase PhoR [Patescibacteria group bacterium]|nr:Two-component system, OmpR family, phosphate regulon sensor histidine kinase PhoR [Patescibacteria group bacterium]